MAINLADLGEVYIVCGKTDLRRGIDGLAYLIQEEYELDPFNQAVYLFCGSRNDRFKALFWDGQGFCLLYKRFENGHLSWPRDRDDCLKLTNQQIEWLMQGFTISPKIHSAQSGAFY